MYFVTRTVPGRLTRPRSLRPRSTSMTCSAFSFGSRWSCSARSWSSAGVAPRGRVPAIGWVVRRSPSTWRRSSGLAPTTSNEGVRTKNRYGLGLTRRSARYSPIPSIAGTVRPGRQVERLASGEDDLDRLAGGDRVLGGLDGPDVGVPSEARLDPCLGVRAGLGGRRSRAARRRGGRSRRLRRARRRSGRAVRSSASKIARSAIA